MRPRPVGVVILVACGLAIGCNAQISGAGAPDAATNSTAGGAATAGAQLPTGGAVTTGGNLATPVDAATDAGQRTDSGAPDAGDATPDAGLDAATDAGSSSLAAKPSAGCGKASPPSGALQMEVSGNTGNYIVSVPASYDPANAYPLGFAFHGRGRTGPNCQSGDCIGFQDVMQDDALLVYMTSLGGDGWDGNPERELCVSFFESVLAELKANYCVDENRVFVAGTSSGAHFANILGCRFGDDLLAIAPVAGYLPEMTCTGDVAALVIHGVDDYHVSFTSGEEARDFWRVRNHCGDTTVAPIPEAHDRVVATKESYECVDYVGCDSELPVVWCEHSEGGYDGSTHGWPTFAGQRIWDFVQSF